jgi:hypothetical protein
MNTIYHNQFPVLANYIKYTLLANTITYAITKLFCRTYQYREENTRQMSKTVTIITSSMMAALFLAIQTSLSVQTHFKKLDLFLPRQSNGLAILPLIGLIAGANAHLITQLYCQACNQYNPKSLKFNDVEIERISRNMAILSAFLLPSFSILKNLINIKS